MKLWQIDDKIEAVLMAGTDPATGEISEEALAALDELEGDKDKKLLACGYVVMGELAEAEGVKGVIAQLQARVKSHQSRANSLRGYMEQHCPAKKCLVVKDERISIKVTESKRVEPSVELSEPDDYGKIDANYVKREVKLSIDKAAAAKVLKSGEEILGLHLTTHHQVKVSAGPIPDEK